MGRGFCLRRARPIWTGRMSAVHRFSVRSIAIPGGWMRPVAVIFGKNQCAGPILSDLARATTVYGTTSKPLEHGTITPCGSPQAGRRGPAWLRGWTGLRLAATLRVDPGGRLISAGWVRGATKPTWGPVPNYCYPVTQPAAGAD